MTGQPTINLRRGSGPFSRVLDVHDVKDVPLELRIEATDEERRVAAVEGDLPAIAALSARFRIQRRAGGRLEVDGELTATITQVCVVTLDRFDSEVEQAIALTFAPAVSVPAVDGRNRGRQETAAEPVARPVAIPGNDDQPDPPDPIVNDRIDLGAVACEFLQLARDLYPRKPGAAFADVIEDDGADEEPSALASALGRLKDRS